jgi:hypothetical protein
LSDSIEIRIDHHVYRTGAIQGFRHFWAFYVCGFDQSVHCQPCFRGSLSRQFNTRTAESGRLYVMNERKAFRYLYICGVGVGPKNLLREKNFHLPLRFEAGARQVGHTYNGYTVTVENAVALPIPELEPGWQGLDLETTRCKNFRFGVEYFGWQTGAPHYPQRSPDAGSMADARRAGR